MDQQTETRIEAWQWPDAAISEASQNAEPRFQLYPPVKVTLLDDPEAELDCLLTHISLTDIKILADDSLPEDEIIVIELEDSFLLSDVRYCLPRKSKYVIGCSRMHTLQKLAMPHDASKIAMLEALIGDFHAQCATQIEKLQEAIQGLQNPSHSEGARRDPAAFAPFAPRISDDAPLGFTEAPSLWSKRQTVPKEEPLEAVQPEPSPTAEVEQDDSTAFRVEPFKVLASRAAQVLRAGSAQMFNGSAEGESDGKSEKDRFGGRKYWTRTVALATGVAMMAWAALLVWKTPDAGHVARAKAPAISFPEPAQSIQPRPVAESTSKLTPMPVYGAATKPPVTPIPAPANPSGKPQVPVTAPRIPTRPAALVPESQVASPVAAASSSFQHASVKTPQSSWIHVCADGRELFQKLLGAGQTQEFDFSKRALLLIGNTDGAEVAVNGVPMELQGRPGAAGTFELNAEGRRFGQSRDGLNQSGCGSRQDSRSGKAGDAKPVQSDNSQSIVPTASAIAPVGSTQSQSAQ